MGQVLIEKMMVAMDNAQIRPARASDLDQLAVLLEALWPQSSAEKHAQELRLLLGGQAALVLTMPLTILVAEASDGNLSASWKSIYVRMPMVATRQASYIEGWYVSEDHRHRGVGRKLLAESEDWARTHGCVEMGSDATIDNAVSHRAHQALAYEVLDRCVHFRKRL